MLSRWRLVRHEWYPSSPTCPQESHRKLDTPYHFVVIALTLCSRIGILRYQSTFHLDWTPHQEDTSYLSSHQQIHWRFPGDHRRLWYGPLSWSQPWSLYDYILPLFVRCYVWWYWPRLFDAVVCTVLDSERKETGSKWWRSKWYITKQTYLFQQSTDPFFPLDLQDVLQRSLYDVNDVYLLHLHWCHL